MLEGRVLGKSDILGGQVLEGRVLGKSDILGGPVLEGGLLSKSDILGGLVIEGRVLGRSVFPAFWLEISVGLAFQDLISYCYVIRGKYISRRYIWRHTRFNSQATCFAALALAFANLDLRQVETYPHRDLSYIRYPGDLIHLSIAGSYWPKVAQLGLVPPITDVFLQCV